MGMMATLLEIVGSWQSLTVFLVAVATFGFFPGFLLRILVRIYPADDLRRRELPAELYTVPRLVRPFWVAEQLETVLHEGTGLRCRDRRTRRLAKRLTVDGLAALDAEALRAIEEADAADDDMVFVALGSTTLIAQRVGAVRRGERRGRERSRSAVRQALLSRRRKRYIRDLRLRLTARVGSPMPRMSERPDHPSLREAVKGTVGDGEFRGGGVNDARGASGNEPGVDCMRGRRPNPEMPSDLGAECGTRTHTSFRTTVFETVASASSANSAHRVHILAAGRENTESRGSRWPHNRVTQGICIADQRER